MKKRKLILAATLVAGMMMSMIGMAEEQELVYVTNVNTGSMNAHMASGNAQLAQSMVYDGLVDSTEEGIVPALAESWEISNDGLVYTFHLRKNVKFTDGEAFNAEVAKMNFDAVLENKDAYSWMGLTGRIASVEAVDEYTLVLTLTEPYYPTLQELSFTRPYAFMSPNCFIDGHSIDGVNSTIGTGPYIITENVDEQYATFEANEDYWDGAPAIKKITRKIIPDGQTAFLSMAKGEANLAFAENGATLIDADSTELLEAQGYQVIMSDPVSTGIILTNTGNQDLAIAEKAVRLAFWYSIDRDTLCDVVFSGTALPADKLEYDTMPYCSDLGLEERGYNIEKAGELLEEAGWTLEDGAEYRTKEGKELSMDLCYFSDKTNYKTVAELIQDSAKASGIKINLIGEEANSIYARRKSGDYELMLDTSWGLPYESYMTANILIPGGSYQYCSQGLEGADEFYALVNETLTGTDEAKRAEQFKEIFTYIHDEAAVIPLYYNCLQIIAPENLENIQFAMSQYELPIQKFYFTE